ncbi:type II toxin-antitoxin system RelE/ParE family toxin [bacterium]|nr:type II toxin-antitoxin system RelE/ParE family toxin [bacterium]
MLPIRFHPDAQAELTAAVEWYLEQEPRLAYRFSSLVEETLDHVIADPNSHADLIGTSRYRRVPVFPYLVVFEVIDDVLWILAIAHTSRRPGYWQDRRELSD